MTAEFRREGDRVFIELDLLDVIALGGLLREVLTSGSDTCSDREHDQGARRLELRRMNVAVSAWSGQPLELDRSTAQAWLCGMKQMREYLAKSLSVADLEQQGRLALVASWAVDAPMRTSARAYLWTVELVDQLSPLCASSNNRH